MEVMRILIVTWLQPRRTIRIALRSEEEQGLLGSRAYVKNHFADPADMVLKPEHGKIYAYYNLDNGTGKVREDEDRCYFSLARDNLVNSEPLNILDNLLSLVFFHSGI